MIELLVVRHAIAEDREEFAATGQSDDLRPLTKRGRGRMEDAARGLASLTERPDVIATSPYTRAAETAAIVAAAFGGPEPVSEKLLTGEGTDDVLASWLRDKAGGADAKVAIVGHEPQLSGFVSYLLGARGNVVDLKKGAACLLQVDPSVKQGSAVLVWALAPGQLRRLK